MRVHTTLLCLVCCSCAHLTLLPSSASVQAKSKAAPMPQHLHAREAAWAAGEARHELYMHVQDRFDTVHLFSPATGAESLHHPDAGPEQQQSPGHAFGDVDPVSNDRARAPGLGYKDSPKSSPRFRAVAQTASAHAGARRRQQQPQQAQQRQQQQQQQRQQRFGDVSSESDASTATVVEDAVVTGLASAELQAAFLAEYDADAYGDFDVPFANGGGTGVSRSLLQSRRRPGSFNRCPVCTLRRCDRDKCVGQCRQNRELFNCRTSALGMSSSSANCGSRTESIAEIPISTLESNSRLAVNAPSPYIGCALIAGRRSGCPAPGTRGQITLAGQSTPVAFEVGTSTCAFQRYDPGCDNPNHPYGICLCSRVAPDGASLSAGPCNITELDIINSPPARGEAPVVIEARGSITYTGYSDYDEVDHSVEMRQLSISEESLVESIDRIPELFEGVSDVSVELRGTVEVTLERFSVDVRPVDEGEVFALPAGEAVPIAADYYDDADAPPAAIGRAVRSRRERVRVPRFRPPACYGGPYDYSQASYYDYACYAYDYDYENVQYYS